MRPILIGAGRGSRLRHETEALPKTLVSVMGRPMLEWILEALREAGFSKKDVVFVCGYRAEVLRARYPEFTYVENTDWANNNILASLMKARHHFDDGFVSSYTDIVYEGALVEELVRAKGDKVLGCDVLWRRRYGDRSMHPETDAEKLRASGERVLELSRTIASEEAQGEFVGVAKFSRDGAKELCEAFDRAEGRFGTGLYREGRSFPKAYLIDLFQEMLEGGSPFARANTHGGYMEIDTTEDLACAEKWWKSR